VVTVRLFPVAVTWTFAAGTPASVTVPLKKAPALTASARAEQMRRNENMMHAACTKRSDGVRMEVLSGIAAERDANLAARANVDGVPST
jgi:hypothetical protein